MLSADGVVEFASLVGVGFAEFRMMRQKHGDGIFLYSLRLTDNGRRLLKAWGSGDRATLNAALGRSDKPENGLSNLKP